MKSSILLFLIFAVLLFVGIAIMMKPAAFVSAPIPNDPSASKELNTTNPIPRVVIILGSASIISGLVGLSVQGFRMFKDFDRGQESSN